MLFLLLLAAQDLTDDSFIEWRDFIVPAAEEMAWADVPWRATFWEAVREGARDERPILLWAMNGHPLGLT